MSSTLSNNIDDMVNAMPTFDMDTCDTGTSVILGVICLVALLVSFCGYRLYYAALGLLAFLVAASAEGSIGAAWIAQSSDKQVAKKVIVAVFCIVWGLLGAWICKKMAPRLNQFLGFVLGAAVGAAAVGAVIAIIKEFMDEEAGSGFQGWDTFALFTIGVPVALLVGYLSRNSVKYFLMATSALLGAYVAVRSVTTILLCAEADAVFAKPGVQLVAVLVIAVLGAATQYYTRPKEDRKVVGVTGAVENV